MPPINAASLSLAGTQPEARHSLEPAEIDQLDIEPADRRRLAEHVGLQRAGGVPGRLPAHGGVEREDQPPAFAGGRRRAERAHLVDECLDLRPGRGRRRGAVFAHGRKFTSIRAFRVIARAWPQRHPRLAALLAPFTFGRGRRDTVLLAKASRPSADAGTPQDELEARVSPAPFPRYAARLPPCARPAERRAGADHGRAARRPSGAGARAPRSARAAWWCRSSSTRPSSRRTRISPVIRAALPPTLKCSLKRKSIWSGRRRRR